MREIVRGVGTALLGMVLLLAFLLPVMATPSQKQASWTVMVYLDADNNLDYYGYVDVAEMMEVGSTSSVNIVVLWDKYDGPAYAYKVLKGGLQVSRGFALNGVEVNMGSGETLKAFVDYAAKKYPASKYALILWDHGDDFRGFGWDDHPWEGAATSDFMTHDEIVYALSDKRLDVLAFDGCVMGNIEVSYEYYIRGLSIEYFVASETYIPLWGFAYDTLLGPLVRDPGMSGYELAVAMVDSYWEFYNGPGWQVGLSVIRMSSLGTLVSALRTLTTALTSDMSIYRESIASARGEAMLSWSLYGWEAYVDLVTWARNLRTYLSSDEKITPLIDDVIAQLDEALPYVRNVHALDVKSAGGLGVFFPGSKASFEGNYWWHSDYYLRMKFPYKGWLDFMLSYWGGT